MSFYSFEMILVGIILLSAMTAGGIKLWLQRRQSLIEHLDSKDYSENPKTNYSDDSSPN